MRTVQSSFAGLFWLGEDSSYIKETAGEVEFFLSDVVSGDSVFPSGSHRSFMANPYSLPRGRVEVDKGKVIISVGVECPDAVIEHVIKSFSLGRFRSVIEVRRNKFWDKRF